VSHTAVRGTIHPAVVDLGCWLLVDTRGLGDSGTKCMEKLFINLRAFRQRTYLPNYTTWAVFDVIFVINHMENN
jgi:hypothetical protein